MPSKRIDQKGTTKILVIQTAFIGDVVLTTPFLGALQARWPDAEIHVVATPAGCEMLAGLKNLHLHALDKQRTGAVRGFRKILESLGPKTEFELVFCVHRSLRSLAIGKKVRAKRRLAFYSFWARLFRFETVIYPSYEEEKHYVDKPLALLAPFGELSSKGKTSRFPALVCSDSEVASVRAKLSSLGDLGYVVLSPFSVWGTKMWFSDRFASVGLEVARRFRLPIVVIGGGSGYEVVVAQTIADKIKAGGGKVVTLVGKTSIGELKAVIRGAKLLVANDSAPVHVAAAFSVPTVAIFGPTAKRWGFYPLARRSVVVERNDLSCRPCHIHGPKKCPKGHFRCMNDIQVEDVMQAVQSLL